LIVSLTTDKYVNKGPGRPFFDINKRLQVLSSVRNVDYVISSDSPSSVSIINKIKPNIYFKGPDYLNHLEDFTGFIKKEELAIKKNKGKIIYGTSETFSSSVILNKISNFTYDQKKIISYVKNKYKFEEIFSKISKVSNNLKILVLGEMIIDKFIFCTALGKSGKEAILNLEKKKDIDFIGGSGAICNNLIDFTKKTELLSFLGSDVNKLKFIKKNLSKKIRTNFFYKKNSKTIIKTKFIDNSTNNKLMGLYDFDDKPLITSEEKIFIKKIKKSAKRNNFIIVSDYGHGLISNKVASMLSKMKNIIINTQLNSANIGYHTISKYKNINWAIINEVELRHEMRNRYEDIKKLMSLLSKKLNIQNLIVTAGNKGSYYLNQRKKKFFPLSSFCNKYYR
jgi:bifunctional ADP-heptose synthase (sugar kinase/adenylyltransferase)